MAFGYKLRRPPRSGGPPRWKMALVIVGAVLVIELALRWLKSN
jgi:antibiotic biosynthesis monooxygenase (ABM) superfamily enzyme